MKDVFTPIPPVPLCWIQTHTGRLFDLLAPTPEMVCVEDVAHALSQICRYTGHTRTHYSVAQHCVLASIVVADELGRPDAALAALLHDAAEAYVGDVSAPLKAAMRTVERCRGIYVPRTAYGEIEERVQAAVQRALGRPHALEVDDVVKRADLMLLAAESTVLLGPPPREWHLPEAPARIEIVPWPAEVAERMFLEAYEKLRGQT